MLKHDTEACERFFNCHTSSAYSVIYIDMQRFGLWPEGREENKPKWTLMTGLKLKLEMTGGERRHWAGGDGFSFQHAEKCLERPPHHILSGL